MDGVRVNMDGVGDHRIMLERYMAGVGGQEHM